MKISYFNILEKLLLFATIFVPLSSYSATALKLDPSVIKHVAYVIAGPGETVQSTFGHSYLLFKKDEVASPTDAAVEFVASVDPAEINYIRGLGLIAYDRKSVIEKFDIVKKEITKIQNRDLVIYDLKLTEDEKNNIIFKINEIVAAGKMGDYSFANSNCADAVSDILNYSGISLKGLSAKIPTKLAESLRKKGLIKKTVTFYSTENTRKNTVKKYAASLKSIPVPKYYRTLDRMFESGGTNQKLFSLVYAKQNKEHSFFPNNIDSFVNDYWLTLTSTIKAQFKNMIAVPVGTVRLAIKNNPRSFEQFELKSTKIDCTRAECFIIATFGYNDEKRDFVESRIPLKSLTIQGDGIYFNELLVGFSTGNKTLLSKDSSILFAATPVVSPYSVNGKWLADIGLIIENNLADTYMKKAISWDKEIIWHTNTDPKHPMCFSIMHLQQAMFEQAIYAPELTKLSVQENVLLLKALLNKQIVVIPGYADAYEFTKSIPHDKFVKTIYPIQEEKYHGLLNGLKQWLKIESLTPQTLRAMAVITHELNISVPVIFRKNNDPSQILSHSVLITDMRDEGDHYSLSGYDPNFTHSTTFGSIDKKTLLMKTKSYGIVNLYVEEMNINNSLLNLQIINSKAIRDLLIRQSAKINIYTYSLQQVLKMQ